MFYQRIDQTGQEPAGHSDRLGVRRLEYRYFEHLFSVCGTVKSEIWLDFNKKI